MHIPRNRSEALEATQVELRAEQAASLGKVGNKLELLLAELTDTEQQLARAKGDDRPSLVRLHAEQRKEAEKYLYYLVVQREALGLYQHDTVYERYTLPQAIRQ